VLRLSFAFALLLAGSGLAAVARGNKAAPDKLPPPAKKRVSYERDIQPLLAKFCYECHGEKKQEGGLRLDQRARATAGGESGEVLTPGDSAKSLLIELVAALDPEEAMPPGERKLTAEQVGLLRAWIDQGLEWPDKLANDP
jgi:hypothetical protein